MNVASQLKFQNVLRGCNILLGYQRVSQRLSMREKVAEFFWTKNSCVIARWDETREKKKNLTNAPKPRSSNAVATFLLLQPPSCSSCSSLRGEGTTIQIGRYYSNKRPRLFTNRDRERQRLQKKECKSQKGWKIGQKWVFQDSWWWTVTSKHCLWATLTQDTQLLSNLFYCCVFRSIKSEFELLCWFPGPEPSPAVPAVNFPGLTFHPPCYAPSPWYRPAPAQCTNTNTQTRLQKWKYTNTITKCKYIKHKWTDKETHSTYPGMDFLFDLIVSNTGSTV